MTKMVRSERSAAFCSARALHPSPANRSSACMVSVQASGLRGQGVGVRCTRRAIPREPLQRLVFSGIEGVGFMVSGEGLRMGSFRFMGRGPVSASLSSSQLSRLELSDPTVYGP